MADAGTRFTDKRQQELERRLRRIYSDVAKDIEAKMRDFNQRHKVKEAKYRQMLKDGQITQADFDSWMRGQVFQGKQWQAKKDQIAETLYQSNQIAARMVRGETVGVFAHNANFMSYQLEHTAGVNFGFGIYDSAAVTQLIRDQPNLLPKSRVKRSKDKQWNSRKLTEQVTQGIIQGESLDKIAKRMAQSVSEQDWKFMRTYAQTAMTGAQNAGRQLSLQNAKSMGIKVQKEWMATLDGHTRTEHQELDGQKVDTDRPFQVGAYTIMYPGDPAAHPAMVYNCRCTLVGDLTDYPSEYKRYDNIDGNPIKNMTYQEWHEAKSPITIHKSAQTFEWNKYYNGIPNRNYGRADTSDALYEIQNGKPNSLEEYMDEDGNLTPERIALHKQIIDNYLAGKSPEQGTATMVMMGGGPASGKSSVIKSGLYRLPDANHSVTVDPDDIKQYLPGYLKKSKTDSTAASFYHEESSMLAKQLSSTCFSENYNVVYDGTGDGSTKSVMKKINGARERGYKVNGMYVTVDTDEALRRNKSRYNHAVANGESPRLVPDEYVIDCHRKVTRISMEVGDQFDDISLYDNNGESGDIKLIATGGSGKKLHAVAGQEEAFEAYLNKDR